MARRQSASVEGIDRLRTALREMTKEAGSPKAIKEAAASVVRRTRRNVHVDTGNLRDHVYSRADSHAKGRQRSYLIGWPGNVRHSWKQEYGTKYIPANPALTSAVEETRNELIRNVREQVKKAAP